MKNYRVREAVPAEAEKELLAFAPLLRRLLFHRGIKTGKDAEPFLNPDYVRHTHDPFLMKDMEKAVERVIQAIAIIGVNSKVRYLPFLES